MKWCRVLCALGVMFYSSAFLAQDITDVEAKPYGSYTGGAIDTVDLATGNLMLNIPIISFPQRGSLPPLSFSVELNNAPYSQTSWATCDPNGTQNGGPLIECQQMSTRYDTSPPGALYQWNSSPISQETNSSYPPAWQSWCGWDSQTQTWSPCQLLLEWGSEVGTTVQNMGAYLTSSFEGGIVQGQSSQVNGSSCPLNTTCGSDEIDYSAIDASGTTHELESDASSALSYRIYRAPDGSGYTFVTDGPGNPYDWNDAENSQIGSLPGAASTSYWLTTANNSLTYTSGVRTGTLYSPDGIQYTTRILPPYATTSDNKTYGGVSYQFDETLTPRALATTATDPMGNIITRGPWYWSGYWSTANQPASDIANIYQAAAPPAACASLPPGPYYLDSVNRCIPDAIAMQSTMYGWQANGGYQSMTWNVPGPGNTTLPYVITYYPINNVCEVCGQTISSTPDPSTAISATGYAITSITLPNGTQWKFSYSMGDSTSSPGDLKMVTTPSGGTISYTYTSVTNTGNLALWLGRCNAICHAVQSRTESDGQGHSWTTTYSYQTANTSCGSEEIEDQWVSLGFSTIETDPQLNDTVHYFCAVGDTTFAPMANQYHEVQTDYWQGANEENTFPAKPMLKSVSTSSGDYQIDIVPTLTSRQTAGTINVLPTQLVTKTPGAGTNTVDAKVYTTLFTATRIVCWYVMPSNGGSTTSTCIPKQSTTGASESIPINFLSPTTESSSTSASSTPLRTTVTMFNFQNHHTAGDPYWLANIVSPPVSVHVSGSSSGSGTTTYGYDENNGSPQGAYGNLTSKTETYILPGSNTGGATTTETSTVYNLHGMPSSTIDADGNTTTITYDGNGLLRSGVQRPATNSISHNDSYTHDLNTSELLSHTDENSQITQYHYDLMGRITSIGYPDGGGSTFCYTDAGASCPQTSSPVPFSLYTSTTATPDPSVVTMHSYDGWGRQYRSEVLSDPAGATIVDTGYDWEGRVTSVSNPYRGTPPTAPALPSCANAYTCYTYDALGRKTIQTQPDNSIQQWCYDGVQTTTQQTNCLPQAVSGSGVAAIQWTDVADETRRISQQVFDGLGRMVAVIEPDPVSGSLGAMSGRSFNVANNLLETDYSYDIFDDLLSVNQLGNGTPVFRSFAYDLPSRVTWACNPEAILPGQSCSSGSPGTRYVYDANSNLIQKTDNRSIGTSYVYDALNRLLSKTYANDTSGTASSCYQYDGAPGASGYLSGRLVAQWTQKGACPSPSVLPSSGVLTDTTFSAYDPMGRLKSEQRCVGVANCASGGYPMSYTYDLAGKLASYPSGFGGISFANGYDASGHLLSTTATTPSSPSTPVPLFSTPAYTPAGALSAVQLGSSINMSRTFDVRQRVTSETDSSSANTGNVPGTATVTIQGSEQSK